MLAQSPEPEAHDTVLDNSRSNWNLEMLVFEERGKPEYPEKNLSEQRREPTTNSTHIWNPHLQSILKGINRKLSFLHQQGNNGESIDYYTHPGRSRGSFTRTIKEIACIVPDSTFASNFPTEIPIIAPLLPVNSKLSKDRIETKPKNVLS